MSDFLIVCTVIISLFCLGFTTGKWQERREWHKNIPASMDKLCIECERVGEDVAYDHYLGLKEGRE